MKLTVIVVLLAVVANGRVMRYRRAVHSEFRMCIPEDLVNDCNEMASQETKSTAKIVCIAARDRMECIDKIEKREADFGTVDPEDMYVAGKIPNQDFTIFEEIRTLDEPEAEFRYEGVAVIHKDLKIDGIQGVKGLKSCHTGVGRNVGYKIPLTKLKNMGIIGKLNEPDLSPRENELKAFSTLFSKACIVGKWSPDPTIDRKLKERYSNLCELCEEPAKCDYPDKYSGYEGALRCLAHSGGEIAWTKVIFVRKFFGLAVGTTPAQPSDENPENYSYLCADGSRVPVTGTPCRWAARPWQGYMTNAAVVKTIDELRTKIANLYTIGNRNHASWLQHILELDNKTLPRENKIIGPKDFLDKANYTDVIERDYGPPFRTIRFCVLSQEELEKCKTLSKAAFSRDIRPRFDCIQEKTVDDCMQTIRDNGADIITLDGTLVDKAKNFNLRPVAVETYGPAGGAFYAVAVVRKNSLYKSFGDLRGAKSCHSGYGRNIGYNAAIYALLTNNLINADHCPYSEALAEFFSGGSCVPGAKDSSAGVSEKTAEKLCRMCGGNVDANDGTSLDSKCNADSTESYFGSTGAFRCLVQGQGDVAFVKHITVSANTDGKNPESWAVNLKSEDYELVCPNGSRAPIDQYEKCNLAQVPPHTVVTSNSKSDGEVDEIRNALVSIGKQFTARADVFKLFGSFNSKKNLLFKDSASGLVALHEDSPVQKKYSDMLSAINACRVKV